MAGFLTPTYLPTVQTNWVGLHEFTEAAQPRGYCKEPVEPQILPNSPIKPERQQTTLTTSNILGAGHERSYNFAI